jgi:hypothetical protein
VDPVRGRHCASRTAPARSRRLPPLLPEGALIAPSEKITAAALRTATTRPDSFVQSKPLPRARSRRTFAAKKLSSYVPASGPREPPLCRCRQLLHADCWHAYSPRAGG